MFFLNWNLNLSTCFDGQILFGLGGNDKLSSKHNNTTLYGASGNDTLTTNLVFGFDYVRDVRAFQFGGAGNDKLRVDIGTASGNAKTILDGGDGNDTMEVYAFLRDSKDPCGAVIENCATGGSGNDTISLYATIQNSDGHISNKAFGGLGNDTIMLSADTLESHHGATGWNYAEGGKGDDVITARGYGSSHDSLVNELYGDQGNDTLTAYIHNKMGASILHGGDGNDTLSTYGGSGNKLYGGAGNDTLIGGEGDDILFGGTGNDIMSTGEGLDLVVFGKNSGQDVLTQFCLYRDKIVFEGGQGFAGLQQGSDGTKVLFTDGSSVLLQGQHFTDTMAIFG